MGCLVWFLIAMMWLFIPWPIALIITIIALVIHGSKSSSK